MKLYHYRAVEEETGEWFYYRDDARADSCVGHGEGEHHTSAALAVDCYRQWLLDNHLVLNEQTPGTSRYCCHEAGTMYTDWTASIPGVAGGGRWWICDDHRTRENVEAMLTYLDDMYWKF